MPRIFDNIEQPLLDALLDTLKVANRADFCVGYFNLRGWKQLDEGVERWAGGDGQCCRLLVGMQRLPQEDLQALFRLDPLDGGIDNQTALRLKKKLVEDFRNQLTVGAPTNEDEAGLRRLAAQIRGGKVVVKLFLAHPLHAKLYLLFRPEKVNPAVGFVGSSNLTLSGLSRQGELNVDVLDHDACDKLAAWFEDRWNDPWCLDISDDLARVIDESWAGKEPPPPYYIYIKMAYHLSQEARTGVKEFRIPRDFGDRLFEFQVKAVQIAAHHLNKRGGVLIGDVVGLGKTLMATALARIFEDDHGLETLILCPRNLVAMWEDYRDQYRLRGRVLSVTMARRLLPELRRYRLVLIDESHNLRNREGKTYRAIREYIEKNDSKCILLSATPYNKTYLDLSNQLRLFLTEEQDLGVRPEKLLRELGETEFLRRYQCGVRTLAAFEKSPHADDWRELMRLFLVRRTRSFIKQHYAQTDAQTGRKFLVTAEGTHLPFPDRVPRTIKVKIDRKNDSDQYACLYDTDVVDTINRLHLPRYGLGNYIAPSPEEMPTRGEAGHMANLSRAGRRLMGFCRTNLFKRLESSGQSFLLSIERHILRNFVFLHALNNDLPLPLGPQDAELLDSRFSDDDEGLFANDAEDEGDAPDAGETIPAVHSEEDFAAQAAEVYQHFAGPLRKRFHWLRASLFVPALTQHLRDDVQALRSVLAKSGSWNADADAKLKALIKLTTQTHPNEKVLVFTQFADTVHYLAAQFQQRGVAHAEGATGSSEDPTKLAWRFSPNSNGKRDRIASEEEIRVLIATDVLSEGQNLQDAAIVVNYDLPWAIIRLIQRAGRVDRIGQNAEKILCYSFLPADGVNRIIRLRERVTQRLKENAEVVGTDEAFFEGPASAAALDHLYNEKAGVLDGDADNEIDLSSYAYQVWNDAITADPALENKIRQLSNVVYSTKAHKPTESTPEGVLVYLRSAQGNDALAWLNRKGQSITESQFAILDAAACKPDASALPRNPNHHQLVRFAVERAAQEEKQVGGQLGRPSGARFRTYDRLRTYADAVKGTLFETQELLRAVEEVYRFPLCETARDTLNRQLKSGIDGADLVDLVLGLRREGRFCQVQDEAVRLEPQIICSLGLSATKGAKP